MSAKSKGIKTLKISLIVLVALVVAFGVTLGILVGVEHLVFKDFYDGAVEAFDVPGIKDGAVPQGIAYFEKGIDDAPGKEKFFLVSAYMDDGSPSRIYVVNEDKTSRFVTLNTEAGEPSKAHVGGIAVYNRLLYVCDSSRRKIMVFNLMDLFRDGDSITAESAFAVGVNPSYCAVKGDRLYVGDYYKTPDGREPVTATDGSTHYARVAVYPLDAFAVDGMASYSPLFAYSTSQQAQGFAVADDGRILVTYSGPSITSHIRVFTPPEEATGEVAIGEDTVQYFSLDSNCEVKDIKAPPMIETLVPVDGKMFVLNESSANKYVVGKPFKARKVWGINI
jgi:hypothetical protein